jgi:hypothetical protein
VGRWPCLQQGRLFWGEEVLGPGVLGVVLWEGDSAQQHRVAAVFERLQHIRIAPEQDALRLQAAT